jgi:hypothetical protein
MTFRCTLAFLIFGWGALNAEENSLAAAEKILRQFNENTHFYGLYTKDKKIGWASIRYTFKPEKLFQMQEVTTLFLPQAKGEELPVEKHVSESTDSFRGTAPFDHVGSTKRSVEVQKGTEKLIRHLQLQSEGKLIRVTETVGGEQGLQSSSGFIRGFQYRATELFALSGWLQSNPAVNQTFEATRFDPNSLSLTSVVYRLEKILKRDLGTSVFETYVVESMTTTSDLVVKGRGEYDTKGTMLWFECPGFAMRLEPEDAAKDVSAGYVVPPEDIPARLSGKLAELELKSPVLLEVPKKNYSFTSSPNQTVEKLENTLRIHLGKKPEPTSPVDSNERQGNLMKEAYAPSSLVSLEGLVRNALVGAKTDREKALAVLQIANGFLVPKSTTGDLTLEEILKSRSGDCSEYATLVTALSRTVGIPCRSVYGFLIVADRDFLEGHAWNEMLIDGAWTPVDATTNQIVQGGTHLYVGNTEADLVQAAEALRGTIFKVLSK